MSYNARFNFVGTAMIPKQKPDSKRPFYKALSKEQNGVKLNMASLNFGVKENEFNIAFVEAFDGQQEIIKTYDTNNEKLDVKWSERLNEDVVAKVANYRKHIVDLGEDYGGRREFITGYDMIHYLYEYLPKYKGRVVVTGQFTREYYAKNQKYYNKYRVQNVFAASEEKRNRLTLTVDLYYCKESLDDSEYEKTKKLFMDCYYEQYINRDEGKKFVPVRVVFSGEKYNMDDPKQKGLFEYKMKYIKTKSKRMVHIPWEIVVLNGAEEAEFNESMLTDAQAQSKYLRVYA